MSSAGQREAGSAAGLGAFIREQRRLANLSVRRLAALAQISNPYLSQLERGLSEPSVRVLNSLAQALDVSAEVLLDQAGLLRDIRGRDRAAPAPAPVGIEAAIAADGQLSLAQKRALLAVYRSYLAGGPAAGDLLDTAPA